MILQEGTPLLKQTYIKQLWVTSKLSGSMTQYLRPQEK